MTTHSNYPNVTRLLHITTVPLSFKFFEGQVAFMKSQGYEVFALSSPGKFLENFASKEQIQAFEVKMLRKISPIHDLKATFQIWMRINHLKPKIVHSHTPKGGLLGTIAAWVARTPIRIYHIRGLPLMTAYGYKRQLLLLSEKVSCLLATKVLCVSHSIRDVAIAEKICPPGKIQVLLGGSGNGVDAINRFNPKNLSPLTRENTRKAYGIPNDALVLGFIGRIVKDKGVHELVDAWKKLREEHPKLHLLVVGMLEPQDPISIAATETLQKDSRIHMAGYQGETAHYYAAMDIVVLPTYREGFPNVPMEAASMELPVVATQVPGCIDAIQDGVTGTLVAPYSSQLLGDAIQYYVDHPDIRKKHGLAGRDRVLSQFSQEKIWQALEEQYSKLLGQVGP